MKYRPTPILTKVLTVFHWGYISDTFQHPDFNQGRHIHECCCSTELIFFSRAVNRLLGLFEISFQNFLCLLHGYVLIFFLHFSADNINLLDLHI